MSLGGSREFGTVKWFNERKGYGFVERDNGGGDIFVHFSAIDGTGYRSLEEGERVSFVLGSTDKGPQAELVQVE